MVYLLAGVVLIFIVGYYFFGRDTNLVIEKNRLDEIFTIFDLVKGKKSRLSIRDYQNNQFGFLILMQKGIYYLQLTFFKSDEGQELSAFAVDRGIPLVSEGNLLSTYQIESNKLSEFSSIIFEFIEEQDPGVADKLKIGFVGDLDRNELKRQLRFKLNSM